MHSRDLLGFALEASLAEGDKSRWAELADARGRNSLVTSFANFLPGRFMKRVVKIGRADTLPFRTNSIEPTPFARGGESIVYRVKTSDGDPVVVKVRHTNRAQQTDETIKRYRNSEQLYRHYFGALVVPSHHVVYESPFGTKRPVIATIQPEINGQWLFDDLSLAKPDQLEQLYGATLCMVEETDGQGPDFEGVNNVIVTEAGDIKIVDTGALIPMYSPRVAHWTAVRIDEIGKRIQNDIVPATALNVGCRGLLGEPTKIEAAL